MEHDPGSAIPETANPAGEREVRGAEESALGKRSGPTWRGFAVSILVAVILSVLATLLLGGSWSSFSLRPAAAGSDGGCGEGKSCCPLPQEERE